MSKDWYQDIVDFHEQVMEDNFSTYPHIPTIGYKGLRRILICEEYSELLHELAEDNLVGIADGIADLIVVLLGTAVTYGIDIRPVWDEVVKANSLKASGPTRSDGKKLKPAGWVHPDISKLLKAQAWEGD